MSGLRVALLSYRSKPHSGGQGVYVRHLSRELATAGHDVTVLSGQPYPDLEPGVRLHRVPSLDLYREPDPFRVPRSREYRDVLDVLEVLGMLTAGFPEPLTFSVRALRELRGRAKEFDVVHDNQGLGYGMLGVPRLGLPLVTTIHHPITRDRVTDLAAATACRRLALRRWYGFLRMQGRVARAQRHILTVSAASAADIVADFRVDPARVTVVPLGVQTDVFAPPAGPRMTGRIVAMASADAPIKGVDALLRAVARLRRDAPSRPLELVLVIRPRPGGLTERLVRELGLADVVRLVNGLDAPALSGLLGSAQVACVPSRYEGFSLPAVEAMACATPLVGTRAGAIPEVVGEPGRCADLVPPGDDVALADALGALLDDAPRRAAMGRAGRERAVARYDWAAVAQSTAAVYGEAIAAVPDPRARRARVVPAGDVRLAGPTAAPDAGGRADRGGAHAHR